MHTVEALLPVWLGMAIALLLDHELGEPPPRWHPVVWMGRYLQYAGAWLQTRTRPGNAADQPSFWRGALAWWGGLGLVLIPASLLQWLLWQLPWFMAALLAGLLLKPLLAWRLLAQEVLAVEASLAHSLEAGRQQLARIVSRDVQQLDATQVRESALESLAENLNDSVIAPLCWFCLLGYRGIYRGQRWEWAGKWAARADDVLAWLPARITAWALLLAAGWHSAKQLPAQARQTPSPNSGWPMAAMALALNVRLTKPGVYRLHSAGRSPTPLDARRARHLAGRMVQRLVALAVLGLVLGCTMGRWYG
jgi:adenosylcobinamide-phosphate synthase